MQLFGHKRRKLNEGCEEKDKKPPTKKEPDLGLKVIYQPPDNSKTIVE